jgi:predicted DNA-binding protein (MmcQ/YjbR family)
VGVKGWVGARLAAVEDDQLRALLVQSYCLVAPARLRAEVED